jgi:tRNA threonylcarbamoyladenosine biosynthesis protein TsaE
LGAGKTTFSRGLLRELGVTRAVKSPSYGLLELYETDTWQVLHLDLYRLRDPEELENLGLRDYHVGRTLWLVEWPEQGAGHLPPADLRLAFTPGAGVHTVVAEALSAEGGVLLGALMPECGS